jgi:hypothetical protein
VVQVHYDEGVANHIGPEPCAGIREDVGEASAGERAGQPLSRDRKLIPGADTVCVVEGNAQSVLMAVVISREVFGQRNGSNVEAVAPDFWPVATGKFPSPSRSRPSRTSLRGAEEAKAVF